MNDNIKQVKETLETLYVLQKKLKDNGTQGETNRIEDTKELLSEAEKILKCLDLRGRYFLAKVIIPLEKCQGIPDYNKLDDCLEKIIKLLEYIVESDIKVLNEKIKAVRKKIDQ